MTEVQGSRPRGRPPTHGLYSKFRLATLTKEKHEEIVKIMQEQGAYISPSDQWIINTLARALAQLEIISRTIDEHGLFQDDADGTSRGQVTPLLSQFWAGVGKVSKICSQLGLTPEARRRMGKDVPQHSDLASQILEAKES